MKWRKIMRWNDIEKDKEINDSFAFIGNGELFISNKAWKLIDGADSCRYITFVRAKKDRIIYVGIKFRENKTFTSFEYTKTSLKGCEGIIIKAKDLLFHLYGKEAVSQKYTKRSVLLDNENPNVLIIYNKYSPSYVFTDGVVTKRVRRHHVGSILNSEWLVASSYSIIKNEKKIPMYKIVNQYTGEVMEISPRALADIEKGLTTVNNVKKARKIGVNSWRGIKGAKKRKIVKHLENK